VESFKTFNWSFIPINKSVPYAITLPNEIHKFDKLHITATGTATAMNLSF